MTGKAWVFGKEVHAFTATTETMSELMDEAQLAAHSLCKLPLDSIIEGLSQVGERFVEPSCELRQEARRRLAELIPFSIETIDYCLDLLPGLLDRGTLEKRVELELGSLKILDEWTRPAANRRGARFRGRLRALPLGVVVHVAAGNVFLGVVDSLVQGLLTKNVSVVKLSGVDPYFPLLFARVLAEHDAGVPLASSIAIVPWKGGDCAVEAVIKKRSDGVVVWGGDKAVRAYRSGLGPSTRLLEHGPKLSFAVVAADALRTSAERLARDFARDIALWDQAACSSPQFAYVQGSEDEVRDFASLLEAALSDIAAKLPPATLDVHEQVELTKVREMAAMEQALGQGFVLHPDDRRSDWTIVVSSIEAPEQSPLNRCIFLKPIDDIEKVPGLVIPLGAYLQTVGLAGGGRRRDVLASELLRVGVSRICELGRMGEGEIGAPHDGRYGLRDLVRWCADECSHEASLEAFLRFVAERSSWYGERMAGLDLSCPVSRLRIPLTRAATLAEFGPPNSRVLLTGDIAGALVFASGGSTGTPKSTYYAAEEFDEVAEILSRCFRLAGLETSDVAANLFVGGNLYTSFLAVHKALEIVGTSILPIGGCVDFDKVLEYLQRFQATVLLGIPSVLLELTRRARERGLVEKLPLRLMLYAGEHLAEGAKKTICEVFPKLTIRSAGYASVDGGTIGYQCDDCRGSWHHQLTDYVYLEILDPETERPVSAGEVGILVVTNLSRRLQPVVRMPTGDLARFAESPCPCGSSDLLFELLGRIDSRVFVGGGRFMVSDLVDCAAAIEGLTAQVQVELTNDDGSDSMTIRVEADCNDLVARRSSELVKLLYDTFMGGQDDLRCAIEDGWLARPSVEILAPGGLLRNERTGKVRRVIDRRRRSQ